MYATIGQDIDTSQPITLGDIERRSGLYILGRTGMGKSWLLANLILKDIKHGHGVFFLDPHGDAIEDIIASLPLGRKNDVVYLNPEHKTRSFGINLFFCKDIHDSNERQATYTRARNVFSKIFEGEWGTWGPWMQMALQNTLYAFIENQGYTLADVPQFLKNPAFRDHIVRHITHNPAVADFWRYDFSPVQALSLSTRVNILLGHPFLNHIVGQRDTTIDFAEIMDRRYIVLVKLSANLSADIKTFIRTLLISELVHAARRRESIQADKRHQFCIYIDEFQNFSSSEDFAILFTQARKYGIATTIAHQERQGQFADNKMILGATAAAANKIFFQLTVKDAEELAPEFAKPPPTETKLEQELVISQDAVSYLLQRGHKNTEVRAFVNRVLRPVFEQREDIKEDIEYERLIRDQFRDIAAVGRVDAQIGNLPWLPRNYAAVEGALGMARTALGGALGQTGKLLILFARSKGLGRSLRALNNFLTAIMEWRIARGQEGFSQFLIDLVYGSSLVPEHRIKALELYISLEYGDTTAARIVSFGFPKAHGLFPETVTAVQQEAEERVRREGQELLRRRREENKEILRQFIAFRQGVKQAKVECVWQEISHWELNLDYFEKYSVELVKDLVKYYVLLHEYSSVQELLKPYYTARFASSWRDKLEITKLMPKIADGLQRIREDNLRAWESKQEYSRRKTKWFRRRTDERDQRWERERIESYADGYHQERFGTFLLDAFQKFFAEYGEGAFVVLVLVLTAVSPKGWRVNYYKYGCKYPVPDEWRPKPISDLAFGRIRNFPLPKIWGDWRENGLFERYRGYNVLYLPNIQNREPLEILLLLERLTKLTSSLHFEADCAKYYWLWGTDKYYYGIPLVGGAEFHYGGNPYKQYKKLQIANLILVGPLGGMFDDELQNNRDDLQHLKKDIEKDSRRFDLNQLGQLFCGRYSWDNTLVITYLQLRACDIARYGVKLADRTFPQPTIKNVTPAGVANIVDWMVRIMREATQREDKQEAEELCAKLESEAQADFKRLANQIIPMPDLHLTSLKHSEIEAVKEACLKELCQNEQGSWNAQVMLAEVQYYAEIFALLRRPENHVKVPSGQYVEKQMNTRTYADMAHEMGQELSGLDPYTAYAKVIQEQQGTRIVIKRKIRTLHLPSAHPADLQALVRSTIEDTASSYCKERSRIEEEITRRQQNWLINASGVHQEIRPSEEPPPSHY